MSGHSKWANIKRRKEAEDKKRSQIFSKLARAIAAAIKEGGSADPEANARLRMVLQQAKAANMPKENIERALQKGEKQEENLESFVLEGYGPGGVAVMIEALSDNRQRTVQEIKNLFQRHGGNLAEPGAVAFQFEQLGKVEIASLEEEKILELMDLGAKDFEEKEGKIVFYLPVSSLEEFKKAAAELGAKILSWGIIMKAKTPLPLAEEKRALLEEFLEALESHDDVQQVFTNLAS